MSNPSKIHLLFIKERSDDVDLQAVIDDFKLQPLVDKLQKEESLEIVLKTYAIGDPLPEGFVLLSGDVDLSPFIKGLQESGQIDAVKRILPLQVPNGTAQAAINKYPFPAIVEFGDFFKYNQNGNSCSLIIHKNQGDKYEGTGSTLIGDAYRVEGQDLVKIIVNCAHKGDSLGKG